MHSGDTILTDIQFRYLSRKSLRWYGQIPWRLPHNSSHTSYSIDGEPPVNFNLSGIPPPNDTTTANAQVILTLLGLSPGPHTLKVVYKGSSSEVPMSIQYFTATSGSYEDIPGTPGGRPAQVPFTTSQVSTSTTANSNGGRIAPIVGGMLGGLLLLMLPLFGIWFRRHKARLRLFAGEENVEPEPFISSLGSLNGPLTIKNPGEQRQTAIQERLTGSGEPNRRILVAQTPGHNESHTSNVRHSSLSILRHEDSGLRIASPDDNEHISLELPPEYTPQ
ncbi:hypothetical protein M422DRAFT_261297 [Sphaerobolus stellatus SS14]|uniref:Uncharacterized protein n=1 Tax=Sphaerobolus stellatus (strain SS14) TaxID=990650 RepID=A0A0C9V3M6_SPHS4|nr:hypothetical protein M422DRAFT_261297 [Sphaerobolus stellatus SS14]